MKKRYIALTILMVLNGFYSTVFTQQTPLFANYNYNTLVINPAYAGYYSNTDITISNRGYLNQFEGSPRNIGLTFNTPLNSKNVGIGIGIVNDQIGVTNTTSFFGAYSYKLFFTSGQSEQRWWEHQSHTFSFGIMGEIKQYSENLLELGIQDDPNFTNNINTLIPNFGIGFLYNHRSFYAGLSAYNLLGSSLSSDNNINLKSNYYMHLGYRFFTSQFHEILITPSALVKYISGSPFQIDMNLNANYKNKFEIGVGYRTDSSMNFLAGFYISNHLRIFYNYSYSLKDKPLNNSHGLILSYRFGKGFKN